MVTEISVWVGIVGGVLGAIAVIVGWVSRARKPQPLSISTHWMAHLDDNTYLAVSISNTSPMTTTITHASLVVDQLDEFDLFPVLRYREGKPPFSGDGFDGAKLGPGEILEGIVCSEYVAGSLEPEEVEDDFLERLGRARQGRVFVSHTVSKKPASSEKINLAELAGWFKRDREKPAGRAARKR